MCSRAPLVLLITGALTLASCGGSASVDTTGEPAAGQRTLRDVDVPFTFGYPTGFDEATEASVARANALAVVGPAADSYIAVRLNGMKALSPGALERQARTALGSSIQRAEREEHSGVEMVAMTVADSGGEARGLRSTIYGFSLAGRSWLVECHSAEPDRQVIASACRQALDSLRPVDGAPDAAPSVTVSSREGSLTAAGANWPPDVEVALLAGPPRSEAFEVATAQTDAEGRFAVEFDAPALDPASRLVVLACRRDCRVKATTSLPASHRE